MRNAFRSSWLSLLLALWYALVAMPALPAMWSGSAETAQNAGHNAACACASCAGGDACCCAPPAKDDVDREGPAWSSVDCSLAAGWLLAKQAPALVAGSGAPETLAFLCMTRDCGFQSLEVREIGVPEPPPRRI